MKNHIHAFVAAIAVFTAFPALAQIEPGYDPSRPLATTPWYAPAGPAQRAADLNFAKGMGVHHAGALTMSSEYLADPAARNAALKQLARGIIRNQEFEIGMLDEIRARYAALPPQFDGMAVVATKGLSQRDRFFRSPTPGPLDAASGPRQSSVRDVQFAKAMIVHHQAALDMARDYLGNPDTRNGYLKLMCLDILLDQSQEIAFMERMIDAYPGDPDTVKIDASMIHGMEGMDHHGHH